MAVLILPADATLERYTFTTTLNDVDFNFRFWWNARAAFWYFDLYDSNNVLIKAGQKLTVDFPWLYKVTDIRKPKGTLLAADINTTGEAGLTDLGGHVQLVYIEK